VTIAYPELSGPLADDRSPTLIGPDWVADQVGVIETVAARAGVPGYAPAGSQPFDAADPALLLWLLRLHRRGDARKPVSAAVRRAVRAGWAHDPMVVDWLAYFPAEDPRAAERAAALRADRALLSRLQAQATAPSLLPHQARVDALYTLASVWAGDPAVLSWLLANETTNHEGLVHATIVRLVAEYWPDAPETMPWLTDLAHRDETCLDGRGTAQQLLATLLAHEPETLPWLRAITEESDWTAWFTAVRARAVGSTAPEVLTTLKSIVTSQQGYVDEGMQGEAVTIVATDWADDPGTLPWLREIAASVYDPRIAHTASKAAVRAIATGWADDPDTRAFLRRVAVGDAEENWGTREVAVEVLATRWPHDPDMLPFLLGRAVEDVEENVREEAVTQIAAGWAGDPTAAPVLRALAVEDEDPLVHKAALWALGVGWLDDPQTLPWLHRQARADDPAPDVALRVIATVRPDDPATGALLYEAARSADWRLSTTARLLLAPRSPMDDVARLDLRNVVRTERNPLLRRLAVRIVATRWPDHPQTLPWLRDLAERDPKVREETLAAIATGWADDPTARSAKDGQAGGLS
jgi:hypothetical protein